MIGLWKNVVYQLMAKYANADPVSIMSVKTLSKNTTRLL